MTTTTPPLITHAGGQPIHTDDWLDSDLVQAALDALGIAPNDLSESLSEIVRMRFLPGDGEQLLPSCLRYSFDAEQGRRCITPVEYEVRLTLVGCATVGGKAQPEAWDCEFEVSAEVVQ